MLPFFKYQGCGNDFILIDARLLPLKELDPAFVQKLCHRQCGIGADGVLLLLPSLDADVQVTIYNQDGSRPKMCGNGMRCIGQFFHDSGMEDRTYTLEVGDLTLTVLHHQGLVSLSASLQYASWDLFVNQDTPVHLLDTGVPHAVLLVENLDAIDVDTQGKHYRNHPMFAPQGANVTFVQFINKNFIRKRTFERGVEAETLACGSGAIAAALTACHLKGATSPILVKTQSGETLTVSFQREKENFASIELKGPAKRVFEGIFPSVPISLLNESSSIR